MSRPSLDTCDYAGMREAVVPKNMSGTPQLNIVTSPASNRPAAIVESMDTAKVRHCADA